MKSITEQYICSLRFDTKAFDGQTNVHLNVDQRQKTARLIDAQVIKKEKWTVLKKRKRTAILSS